MVAVGGVMSVAGAVERRVSARLDAAYPLEAGSDGEGGYVHDVATADQHAQRLRAEARAGAGPAGSLGHVAFDLAAGVVGLGVAVAALEVGDDALVGGVPRVGAAASGAVSHLHLLLAGSVEDDVELLVGQLADGSVGREVKLAGHGLHHAGVPRVGRAGAGPRHDRALQQGQRAVVDDQRRVNLKLVAQAGAGGARAVGTVEAEGARLDFGQADAAGDAGELLAEGQVVLAFAPHRQHALALAQRRFHRFGDPVRFGVAADDETVNHDVDVVPLLLVQVQVVGLLDQHDFAVDAEADEPAAPGGLEDLPVLALLAADLGGQQGYAGGLGQGQDGVDDLLHGLAGDGVAALGAVGPADAGEEQAQVVVDFGHGADGGAGVVGDALLVDGDGGREALDVVHVGLVHAAEELAGVGGKGLDITALALGVDGVEGQAALAGTGDAGDNDELIPRDRDVDILEVVLASALDVDRFLGHGVPSYIRIVKPAWVKSRSAVSAWVMPRSLIRIKLAQSVRPQR